MEAIDLTSGLHHLLPVEELRTASDAFRERVRKASERWSPDSTSRVYDSSEIEFDRSALGLPESLSKGLAFSCAEQVLQHLVLDARHRNPTRTQGVVAQGSIHGRGVVGRSASGQIELQDPLQAKWPGFQYVAFDDLESLEEAINDQTAFVLTAPNDPSHAGRLASSEYLSGVRRLADENDLMWIADDQLTIAGSCGSLSATQSLSDASPDVVLLRGGLMAGALGGLAIGNDVWFEAAESSDSIVPWAAADPWCRATVEWSLNLISSDGFVAQASEHFHSLLRAIATGLGSDSVVRDVHSLGGTIGFETDLPTSEVLLELSKSDIRAEPAGPNGILLHLPMDSSTEPPWLAAFADALTLTHEAAAGETT